MTATVRHRPADGGHSDAADGPTACRRTFLRRSTVGSHPRPDVGAASGPLVDQPFIANWDIMVIHRSGTSKDNMADITVRY